MSVVAQFIVLGVINADGKRFDASSRAQ